MGTSVLRRMTFVAALAIALPLSSALAQDAGEVEATAESGRSIAFGSTTVDGEQWQRIAFRPEIPIGKFAVALDFELFFNSEGGLSNRGWEFGSSSEIANTLYRKIYYIRYGKPGDPLYARVGALDDVTIGFGMLMSGYRNTLDYPGEKNLGLQFQSDTNGLRIEGMLSNFRDMGTGGPVVGLRVAKPLAGRFEIGASVVYDIDQYGGLADGDGDGVPDAIDRFPDDSEIAADSDRDGIPDGEDRDADGDGKIDVDFGGTVLSAERRDSIDNIMVNAGLEPFHWDTDGTFRQRLFNKDDVGRDPYGMFALDAAFRIIDQAGLKLTAYGQIGTSLDDDDANRATGYGIAAPGIRLALGPLTGRIEYRHIEGEFQPEYFDDLYDHTRAVADFKTGTVSTKDASLDSMTLDGVFGDIGINLGTFARVSGQYQYLHGTESNQRLRGVAGLDQGVMQFVPKLSRLEAFYSKDNIGRYDEGFFEPTVDMMYGYNVGFEMGGGVEIIWSTRWLHEPVGGDLSDVEATKQITFQTVISF